VSSEVETPIDSARTKGLSNPERVEGLEANGIPL
jgi:hypothetical protein